VYCTPWDYTTDEVMWENKSIMNSSSPEFRIEFDRVAAIPYEPHYQKEENITKLNSMESLDCDEKVLLLYDYINRYNGRNVYMMSANHVSGEYSHTFLVWEDKYFDPTSIPPAFDMGKEEYYGRYLTCNGFTGMVSGIGHD
jgi:hypothetical protein